MIDQKIKICFVTCALEVGGAEKFFYDLIKHLDRSRFEPILITVIGGGKLEKDFRALEIPLFIFGRHRIRYFGGIIQFFQLWNLFEKEKPDIVHTQLFAADLWGRLAAWVARVPVIITTEQNINVDQSWLREFLKKLTYKLADKVAAISTAVKKYTIKKYKVPEEKIEIIPNDVDGEKFQNQESIIQNLEKDKKIILTVGRLVEQKGQKYLLAALALLPQKNNCELWLAGEGPLRSDLETQAKNLGISQLVKFLGVRHDVPALLAQVDLFVFPSLWEGLGIAVLEAALAKVPIIASGIDGIVDIIKDKESGLLVPAKDTHELSRALEYLLNNPTEAKQMAEKAYVWVKENFDVSVVVKKYEKMYLNEIVKFYAHTPNQ